MRRDERAGPAPVTGEAIRWGMIDGEPIWFPVRVELNAAILVFPVPADAAGTLVPGDAFEVVETGPGTADLIVTTLTYLGDTWRPYRGLYLGPVVRPAGAPDAETGQYLLAAPVSDRFGCEVAHRTLGVSTSVEDLDVCLTDTEVTIDLTYQGRHALTLGMPRARPAGPPRSREVVAYNDLDGRPQVIPLELTAPTGVVDADDVVVELGDGRLADTLRGLGLPRPPAVALWGEHLPAVFHQARPCAPGPADRG